MCGRFTQAYSWSEVVEFLRVFSPAAPNLRPRYNIGPTTPVEVVRLRDGGASSCRCAGVSSPTGGGGRRYPVESWIPGEVRNE
jgi:putative SOS response-associated peptidase YedK